MMVKPGYSVYDHSVYCNKLIILCYGHDENPFESIIIIALL